MSLSALVNGADCGPGNALQGLSKRFDADRGVSQDQFRSGRAGPSRETFRSSPAQPNPAFAQEAAEFFGGSHAPQQAAPFDLSSLNAALATQVPRASPAHGGLATNTSAGSSSWANDFSARDATRAVSRPTVGWAGDFSKQLAPAMAAAVQQSPAMEMNAPGPQMNFQRPQFRMPPPAFAPFPQPMHMPQMNLVPAPMRVEDTTTSSQWESHFSEVESQRQAPAPELSASDLATTAGLLIETLKTEQNEKFKNSAFMGLMRRVRDHQVVVDGNDLVPAAEVTATAHFDSDSSMASRLAKGKMREIDPSSSTGLHQRRKSVHFETHETPMATEEDFQDWDSTAQDAPSLKQRRVGIIEAQEAEWARLQEDWDQWEANPVGFERPARGPEVAYQFIQHNPYMSREYLQAHSSGLQRSLSQTVLEKEAEVRRNMYDPNAWLELGIKQQENERESAAIAALTQALELDSTLLPAWLSLAISYTNEGNRHDAFKALSQWIENNERYRIISAKYRLGSETPDQFVSMREKKDRLVDCLIEMATKAQEVGIEGLDADVQIALAVLLNTSEDYEKALDCFKAALEARPNDWVLYNRVGATLANSGRPEEALAYYYRALEFNPTYIRARYNLGISCINLRRYEEAASHMLDALVLQESDSTSDGGVNVRGVTSSSLWDTLRTTCHHLNRRELADLCEKRDLDGFRAAFQQ